MLLEVNDLRVSYHTDEGVVRAVDGITLSLDRRETLAVVGESGSGKSTLALAVIGLLPKTARVEGSIRFLDRELTTLREEEFRRLRGDRITIVFQEPMTALNPVFTIGRFMRDIYLTHREGSEEEALSLAREWLSKVKVPGPEKVLNSYPHELSGGMRQRVLIASSLMLEPDLVIMDEPTSALDVSVQAQILRLIAELKSQVDASFIFITHNLGVAAAVGDRVAVMYAGKVVETASKREIFSNPLHPYTKGLLKAVPKVSGGEVEPIPGTVPSLVNPPSGCRFHPRCPLADGRCAEEEPALTEVEPGHWVACHRVSGMGSGPGTGGE